MACCGTEVFLGEMQSISEAQLGLKMQTLTGETVEVAADEWTVAIAVLLKPSEVGSVCASLTIDDPAVASCARMHLVGEDDHAEVSFSGLTSGAVELNPEANPVGLHAFNRFEGGRHVGGTRLDASTCVALELVLKSTCDIEAKTVEMKPAQLRTPTLQTSNTRSSG